MKTLNLLLTSLFVFTLHFLNAQVPGEINLSSEKLSNLNPYSFNPHSLSLPITFEGSKNYLISFKTEPSVIENLLPEPLEATKEGEMVIAFMKHKISSPFQLQYGEVYLAVAVSLNNTEGWYMPVFYLDGIAAVTLGREIWGYNKLGAEIRFTESGNKTIVSVKQGNDEIIQATFILDASYIPNETINPGNIINLKYIPSVEKDSPPDVKQLTISELDNFTIAIIRNGTATLKFPGNDTNPLIRIPVNEVTGAFYQVTSFEMDYGKVLYNYLEE